jgi:hypothetical protein
MEVMNRKAFAICRRAVLVGLIVLLLAACSQAEEEASPATIPTHEPTATLTREPTASPTHEPAECMGFVSGSSKTECGYLVVPEDRTQPDSGMIRLYAVVIPSVSDNPKPDPLVFLSGGPGAPAMMAVGHIQGILGDILQERDLVAF